MQSACFLEASAQSRVPQLAGITPQHLPCQGVTYPAAISEPLLPRVADPPEAAGPCLLQEVPDVVRSRAQLFLLQEESGEGEDGAGQRCPPQLAPSKCAQRVEEIQLLPGVCASSLSPWTGNGAGDSPSLLWPSQRLMLFPATQSRSTVVSSTGAEPMLGQPWLNSRAQGGDQGIWTWGSAVPCPNPSCSVFAEHWEGAGELQREQPASHTSTLGLSQPSFAKRPCARSCFPAGTDNVGGEESYISTSALPAYPGKPGRWPHLAAHVPGEHLQRHAGSSGPRGLWGWWQPSPWQLSPGHPASRFPRECPGSTQGQQTAGSRQGSWLQWRLPAWLKQHIQGLIQPVTRLS